MYSLEPETKVCINCNKPVSSKSYEVHEAYCLRNLMKCSFCLEMIKLTEREEHSLTCASNPKNSAVKKNSNINSNQAKNCLYCEVLTPLDNLRDHEYYCGSRTRKCEHCFKNILYRDAKTHETSCIPKQIFEKQRDFPKKEVSEERKLEKCRTPDLKTPFWDRTPTGCSNDLEKGRETPSFGSSGHFGVSDESTKTAQEKVDWEFANQLAIELNKANLEGRYRDFDYQRKHKVNNREATPRLNEYRAPDPRENNCPPAQILPAQPLPNQMPQKKAKSNIFGCENISPNVQKPNLYGCDNISKGHHLLGNEITSIHHAKNNPFPVDNMPAQIPQKPKNQRPHEYPMKEGQAGFSQAAKPVTPKSMLNHHGFSENRPSNEMRSRYPSGLGSGLNMGYIPNGLVPRPPSERVPSHISPQSNIFQNRNQPYSRPSFGKY